MLAFQVRDVDTSKAIRTQSKAIPGFRKVLARLAAHHGLSERTVAALAAILAAEETIKTTMAQRRRVARFLRLWLKEASAVMPEAALPAPPDPEAPWTIGIGNLYTLVTSRMAKHTRDWALVEAANVLAEAGLHGPTKDAALANVFSMGAESANAAHRGARQGMPRVSLSRDLAPEERSGNTDMWASAADETARVT